MWHYYPEDANCVAQTPPGFDHMFAIWQQAK